jgi:thymidylate synthase ThyX
MDLRVDVLDKGYVRLVDVMGSDLSVANAARASYAKEVDTFSDKDAKLISFLARENHMSPFRHAFMTLEFKAPLMVARQHWKYVVGSDHTMDSWNESCFSGSQTIAAWPYSSGTRKKYTVKELFELGEKNPNYLPRVPSLSPDNEIVANKVKRVWITGRAKVYKVRSSLGFEITTTDNHRYLTENGYVELKNLKPGDSVMMNGIPAYKDKTWLKTHYVDMGLSQAEVAEIAKCSVHTIRKWVRIHALQQDQIARLLAHNNRYGVFGKGLTKESSQVIAERSIRTGNSQRGKSKVNGPDNGNWNHDDSSLSQWAGHVRARKMFVNPTCEFCDQNAQVHHKDKNPLNNESDNLQLLCQNHHDMIHDKRPLLIPHPVTIESIEYIGEEDVYDIEMTDEPNLVVEQFVVHNSRRYVTTDPDFYIIQEDQWRGRAETNKQGSGELIDKEYGAMLTEQLLKTVDRAIDNYNNAITLGVCGEQARAFLPAYNVYVNYRWSCSLQSLCLFLKQRLEEGAQSEIADYARAVYGLTEPSFPVVIKELVGDMSEYHWGAK